MIGVFVVIALTVLIVYLDKCFEKHGSDLGEEWDFVTPIDRRNH